MEASEPLSGTCHCGSVAFEVSRPAFMVACNCSICRRYTALWVHAPPASARIVEGEGQTDTYIWGDEQIEFHSCKSCRAVTHWTGVDGARWAVNMRMVDPADLEGLPVRHFDGADSWEFLD